MVILLAVVVSQAVAVDTKPHWDKVRALQIAVTRAGSHLAFNKGDGHDDVIGCKESTALTVFGILNGIFVSLSFQHLQKKASKLLFEVFFFWEGDSVVLPYSSSMLRLLYRVDAGG